MTDMGEASRKYAQFKAQAAEFQLGDGPVEEQYHAMMTGIMKAVDETFNGQVRPRKTGIVMLVFPYGDVEGRCNFMSNGANRRDIVCLMKEMIARFEGQPEMSGHG
jgi:hypothetical protein